VTFFGSELTAETMEFIHRNFSFDSKYITETHLLNGLILEKHYSQPALISRFEQASAAKEGITFEEFVHINESEKIVKWRGFYTVASPIASPYYFFTTYFND
jgi:hypothetical protein